MRNQEVNRSLFQLQRYIPMTLGGESQMFHGFCRVEQAAILVSGLPGVGHVFPEKVLEGPYFFGLDRIPGEYQHPKLARELTKSEGICRSIELSIAVEIFAGRKSRVDGSQEAIAILDRRQVVLGNFQVVFLETISGNFTGMFDPSEITQRCWVMSKIIWPPHALDPPPRSG